MATWGALIFIYTTLVILKGVKCFTLDKIYFSIANSFSTQSETSTRVFLYSIQVQFGWRLLDKHSILLCLTSIKAQKRRANMCHFSKFKKVGRVALHTVPHNAPLRNEKQKL